MSLYDLGKSVAVTLEYGGKSEPGEVGINKDGTVFGYVSRGAITFMSYLLSDHFIPAKVIALCREKDAPFYFDYGNKFTISADELERAFRELGIL